MWVPGLSTAPRVRGLGFGCLAVGQHFDLEPVVSLSFFHIWTEIIIVPTS